MRGRVSAVNSVFIGASNQLGEFESGVTAAWFGPVPAVVVGGIGTLLVVGDLDAALSGTRPPRPAGGAEAPLNLRVAGDCAATPRCRIDVPAPTATHRTRAGAAPREKPQ